MREGYFATAWADIKNSDGWLKKVMLLGLVGLIPIFGQIVILGYAWGWARDMAWNVHRSLPERIFGNEDGQLYRRGFFLLVIAFVFSLAVEIVTSLLSLPFGGVAALPALSGGSDAASVMFAASVGFGGLVMSLVSIALSVVVLAFTWIGSMRTAIYGRLSAGFQVNKIWSMLRHDLNGIARIVGMCFLVSIVFGLVLSLVMGVVFGVGALAIVASVAPFAHGGMSDAQVLAAAASMTPAILLFLLLTLVLAFVGSAFSVWLELLIARAMGYWTRQFDVPQWRGQDDLMPHEQAAAAAAAAAAAQAAQAQAYAQPAQPVAPVEPVAPAQPVAPVEPVAPVQPTAPAEPVEPAAPAQE